MMGRRFRWTRKLYREASSLARFLEGYPYHAREHAPLLVQRFYHLWDEYPQRDDPLQKPIFFRYPSYCPDGIPF